MEIKLLTFATLCLYGVLAYDYHCSERSALQLHRKPAYDFSVKILQRVTIDTNAHYVYSPLSTWLQLTALAEGARGKTAEEIRKVVKHHKKRCFRRELGKILNKLNSDLRNVSKRKSVIAVDHLMGVNKRYVRDVQRLYGIKVLRLDFNEPIKSATDVNNAIEQMTGGVVDRMLYLDDFMSPGLLLSDANYFISEWQTNFNSVYTKLQPFYSTYGDQIGEVSMMNQIGAFHIMNAPDINAQVLEIPCANHRIKMLVFLPAKKSPIVDLFYRLQRITLTSIFNTYKKVGHRLVNVTIPRFKQQTEIGNLAELVYDMGIKRIFDPDLADLKGISNFKMFASLITQVCDINVSEKGVNASVTAEFLARNDDSIDFLVNRPFAYMLVDRVTEFILFAGVYSKPSVI